MIRATFASRRSRVQWAACWWHRIPRGNREFYVFSPGNNTPPPLFTGRWGDMASGDGVGNGGGFGNVAYGDMDEPHSESAGIAGDGRCGEAYARPYLWMEPVPRYRHDDINHYGEIACFDAGDGHGNTGMFFEDTGDGDYGVVSGTGDGESDGARDTARFPEDNI